MPNIKVGSIVCISKTGFLDRDWKVTQIHVSESGEFRAMVIVPVSGRFDVETIRDPDWKHFVKVIHY